jgi:hypothetical protein
MLVLEVERAVTRCPIGHSYYCHPVTPRFGAGNQSGCGCESQPHSPEKRPSAQATASGSSSLRPTMLR